MSKRVPDFLYQAQRLLGQEIGKIEPFLAETSCMNYNERELVAYCKVYGILFPDDKEFIKFLEKEAIPVLQKIGYAKWLRTELTDLALKKGIKRKTQDVSKVLSKRK